MTSLEKLDAVLKSLEKHHSEKHHDFMAVLEDLNKDKSGIDFGELTYILKKLHTDNFIDIREVPVKGNAKPDEYYYINFNGRVFNEQKGYTNQKIQDRLSRANQKVLVWLTLIIAVGTLVAALYYGIEIWKYFCHH